MSEFLIIALMIFLFFNLKVTVKHDPETHEKTWTVSLFGRDEKK